MKQKIETLTNVAILGFLLVVAVIYITGRFSHTPQYLQIRAGDELPPLPGYSWSSHPRTLVLALRYGCHYCEESVPFYKQLIELEGSGRIKNIHVLAVFPDDAVIVERALQLEGLSVDHIASVPFHGLKVFGTPTVILADQNGRVIGAWVGKLQSEDERGLVNTLELASKS